MQGQILHIAPTPLANTTRPTFATVLLIGLSLSSLSSTSFAPGPSQKTVEAFDRYVQTAEAREHEERASQRDFLWIDQLPDQERERNYAALKQGQAVIRSLQSCEPRCAAASGGLIHAWVRIVFVPGVSLRETIATLQDYDRDADYYQPQVVRSRLLARSGNDFRVFLRLKQTYGITVVMDTEYQVHYSPLDGRRAASQSHSTRINEVENAGLPSERIRPVGDDHGFLWRLYSYWHFYEADGGVYIQCNAISLTRDVPPGLGWLVGPFIEIIPRESLQFTLDATRKALLDKFQHRNKS
jgi:hypothetical protein